MKTLPYFATESVLAAATAFAGAQVHTHPWAQSSGVQWSVLNENLEN